MVSSPVASDESLEAHFALQKPVQELRVLATVRVVVLGVDTHDTANSSSDRVDKRPHVEFVHGLIVNVGRQRRRDVVSTSRRFSNLTEVLCGKSAFKASSEARSIVLTLLIANLAFSGLLVSWIMNKNRHDVQCCRHGGGASQLPQQPNYGDDTVGRHQIANAPISS